MSSYIQQSTPPGLLSLLVTKYEEKFQKHALQNLYKLQVESYKNALGKYECPICKKSYVHFKHLRRHNRQHTGYRPYVCHICRDTFCRSDILKRHYERCISKFIATGKLSARSRVPKVDKEYVDTTESHPQDSVQTPQTFVPIINSSMFNSATFKAPTVEPGSNPKFSPSYDPNSSYLTTPKYTQKDDYKHERVSQMCSSPSLCVMQPISYSSPSLSAMAPLNNLNNVPSPKSTIQQANGMGSLVEQENTCSVSFDASSYYTARDSVTPIVSHMSLDEAMNCIPLTGSINVSNTLLCDSDYLPEVPVNRKLGQFYSDDRYTYNHESPSLKSTVPKIINVGSCSKDTACRWLEADW